MSNSRSGIKFRMTKKAFTLIELVVAVTILSIIMLSVFVIYSNLISVNRKLEQTRILQEQTRRITETIATDVRENGIGETGGIFGKCDESGILQNECLATKSNKYLLQQKDESGNFTTCDASTLQYPCQVMTSMGIPLTSDSVDVRNLHFYVTGTAGSGTTNTNIEGKVQMVFDIGIAAKKGVTPEVAKASVITVQTTISEKIYKENQ